jgi:hypothetical protein
MEVYIESYDFLKLNYAQNLKYLGGHRKCHYQVDCKTSVGEWKGENKIITAKGWRLKPYMLLIAFFHSLLRIIILLLELLNCQLICFI